MGEPIKEGSLTGHRRYRRQDFGTSWRTREGLVLQVCYNHWAKGREDKPGRWVPMWRDATPEDVTGAELYDPAKVDRPSTVYRFGTL
jgi:hypothetical protein